MSHQVCLDTFSGVTAGVNLNARAGDFRIGVGRWLKSSYVNYSINMVDNGAGKARPATTDAAKVAVYYADSYLPGNDLTATLVFTHGGDMSGILGLILCGQTQAGTSYYTFRIGTSGTVADFYKFSPGNTATQVGGNVTVIPPASGTLAAIKIIKTGTSFAYYYTADYANVLTSAPFALLMTEVDADYAGGWPGILMYNTTSDDTGWLVDSFIVDDPRPGYYADDALITRSDHGYYPDATNHVNRFNPGNLASIFATDSTLVVVVLDPVPNTGFCQPILRLYDRTNDLSYAPQLATVGQTAYTFSGLHAGGKDLILFHGGIEGTEGNRWDRQSDGLYLGTIVVPVGKVITASTWPIGEIIVIIDSYGSGYLFGYDGASIPMGEYGTDAGIRSYVWNLTRRFHGGLLKYSIIGWPAAGYLHVPGSDHGFVTDNLTNGFATLSNGQTVLDGDGKYRGTPIGALLLGGKNDTGFHEDVAVVQSQIVTALGNVRGALAHDWQEISIGTSSEPGLNPTIDAAVAIYRAAHPTERVTKFGDDLVALLLNPAYSPDETHFNQQGEVVFEGIRGPQAIASGVTFPITQPVPPVSTIPLRLSPIRPQFSFRRTVRGPVRGRY